MTMNKDKILENDDLKDVSGGATDPTGTKIVCRMCGSSNLKANDRGYRKFDPKLNENITFYGWYCRDCYYNFWTKHGTGEYLNTDYIDSLWTAY